MSQYEYRILPSPRRAKRAKGARTPQDRFARTLTDVINAEAAEGWEYVRADTLPVDEKKGMLSSATEVYQTVLVFRRDTTPTPPASLPSTTQEPQEPQSPRDEPAFTRREQQAEKPAFHFGPADDD